MEMIICALLGLFIGFILDLSTIKRLYKSNDKLKATLVKKDFEIAKLEKYNQELKKIVEFYDK